MTSPSEERRISTTERSFEIIDELRELDGARIQTLADRLNVTKSTVYQHLTTLQEIGYITKEGDHFYPSIHFAHIGEYARSRKEEFNHGKKIAELLTKEIGLNSSFYVEENGYGLMVHSESQLRQVPHLYPQVGQKTYLHTIAGGKVILANLPRNRIHEIISKHGLVKQTDSTITDETALYDQLEVIRDRGYAFNRGENRDGALSVGIPLFESRNSVIGGVSVGGGEYQLDEEWLTEQVPTKMKSIRDENPL